MGKAVAAGLAALVTTATAQAQSGSLTLHDGVNFTGRTITLDAAAPDFSQLGFDDHARSARAVGRWIVCDEARFAGRCWSLDGPVPDLGLAAGLISSARPDGAPAAAGEGSPPPPPGDAAPAVLILFGGPGFTGAQRVIRADAPDLRRIGFNDRAFSVRVAPGQRWRLCANRGYRGACHIVSADVPDLRALGLGGAMSSLRREGAADQSGAPQD